MTEVAGAVHTYEEEFPKHLGPPPVPNNTGAKLHNATKPTYLLQIDSGAFMAVWEHLEAETKRVYPTKSTYAHVRAYMRAIEAFRKCYWSNNPPPEPAPPRKLVRKPRRSG